MNNEFTPLTHDERILPADTSYQELSLSAKLASEFHLLGQGIKEGFTARLNRALSNPETTALEYSATLTLGFGLTALNQAGGKAALVAKIASRALGIGFAADALVRGGNTAFALYDNWSNPQNFGTNKEKIAQYLGAAAFDYSVMLSAGTTGSILAKPFLPKTRVLLFNESDANVNAAKINFEAFQADLKLSLKRFAEVLNESQDESNARTKNFISAYAKQEYKDLFWQNQKGDNSVNVVAEDAWTATLTKALTGFDLDHGS